MVLRNIRVTGPHPYRGGDIDVSLALYRLQRTDHARSLLNIVDGIASSIGGPGEMGTALRFGGALLDGVQALLGLQNTSTRGAAHLGRDLRHRSADRAVLRTERLRAAAVRRLM